MSIFKLASQQEDTQEVRNEMNNWFYVHLKGWQPATIGKPTWEYLRLKIREDLLLDVLKKQIGYCLKKGNTTILAEILPHDLGEVLVQSMEVETSDEA